VSGVSAARPVLVLATLNPAKVAELTGLLAGAGHEVRPLADWPGAELPEETEATYAGNALLKARAAVRITGCPVLADDSGLEVDALDGAPGIKSARYGGPGLDDGGRLRRLLDALRDVPPERRTARFRCLIALLSPGGEARFAEGVVEGVIAASPRGTGGFGYDPVFVYPPLGRTLAELTEEEKATVSHRARAVGAARAMLAAG
jgi:XTP/dITP diphosphohydrolase